MTTTLAVTELQARAYALDSALGLLRLELERGCDIPPIVRYFWKGRREFNKLIRLLRSHWDCLSYSQLARVADILEMAELLNPLQDTRDDHHWWERKLCDALSGLQTDVDALVGHLRLEAHRRMRAFGSASLSPYQRQQAAFANVFLRRVTPDPAEALADPDYGF
jgi:hypothetical protein